MRDGVLSIAVAAEQAVSAYGMTGAYDVWRASAPHAAAAAEANGARCAAEQIADEHQHVVNVEGRQLMCVCRGCYLLFTDDDAPAALSRRPRPLPVVPGFRARTAGDWEALQIPVGLAFFFRNSSLDRTVAFYPGPAGATESELDLDAWNGIRAADPAGRHAGRRHRSVAGAGARRRYSDRPSAIWCPSTPATSSSARLRMLWHGFDGGQHVREFIDEFFDHIASRGKAVQPT